MKPAHVQQEANDTLLSICISITAASTHPGAAFFAARYLCCSYLSQVFPCLIYSPNKAFQGWKHRSQRKHSHWGGNFRSCFEGLAVVSERRDSGWGNNLVRFCVQSLSFKCFQGLSFQHCSKPRGFESWEGKVMAGEIPLAQCLSHSPGG